MPVLTSTVVSINISPGGIPKLPVGSVKVKKAGLEGDGHNHEKHYNVIQAVSLQDIEILDELNSEGYRLECGSTGENVDLSGVYVNSLPLGTRLEFSGGVVVELSKVRKPCYVLDVIDPKLKEDIIGRCGMYAKVLNSGRLSAGESVTVCHPAEQTA